MQREVTAVIAGIAIATAASTSAYMTIWVRRFALARGVLDVPNERSSHSRVTPRTGGIAVVLTVTLSLVLFRALGWLEFGPFAAMVGGGTLVALVGYLDDRHHLPASLRIIVHFAAAAWALAFIGGARRLQLGSEIIQLGWLGDAIGAVGVVWVLNLFNFMDGIDGIAASEAAFVAFGGSLLGGIYTGNINGALPGIVFGAACVGFLFWNWPPAKIFMGDVGSGYMGYFIALLALAQMRNKPSTLWIWLILAGIFVTDSSLTLVRRLLRRERLHEAHRSHAYQWLARRWHSHRKVTLTVIIVNLVWLLPCAVLASLHAAFAPWITVGALLPVALAAALAGAGRPEHGVDQGR